MAFYGRLRLLPDLDVPANKNISLLKVDILDLKAQDRGKKIPHLVIFPDKLHLQIRQALRKSLNDYLKKK